MTFDEKILVPSARDFRSHIRFDPQEFRGFTRKTIFFVVPPGNIEMNYGKLSAAGGELPWLGMAYVAAAARETGHEVHLRDYEVTSGSYENLASDIARIKPDIVASAVFINNVDRCLKVCQVVKNVDKRIKTVLGGPQASAFPDEFQHLSEVDFIFIGESEISFARLASHCENPATYRDLPGLCWRDASGKMIRNDRQLLIENIDSVPLPALDLYPMERYYPPVYIWGHKVAHIITSRGCPFRCTFCEAKLTFGRTHRFHSEERVVKDLDFLHDRYGHDSFQFYDDIFTVDRKRVIRLCNLLMERNWRYKWMCYTRTDLVDPELLAIMREAGCYQISYGPESGSQRLLDKIKKSLTVEDNYRGITYTREAGILSVGTFMLGLPGETPEETEATIKFSLSSGLDFAIFGITEPYPGTELWRDCQAEGYFIDADDEHTNHLLPNFSKIWVPFNRTRDELEAAVQRAYRRFYLRPRVLWNWTKNLIHIPPGRCLRSVRAGINYLLLDPLGTSLKKIFVRFPLKASSRKSVSYRGRGYRW